MITILKILWIFWGVVVKLVGIGCAGYVIEKIFDFLNVISESVALCDLLFLGCLLLLSESPDTQIST